MGVGRGEFEPGLSEPPITLEGLLAAESSRVDALDGTRVGSLRGVLVDAIDGSPTWGLVKLGRFGRCTAVPAAYLAPSVDRVWAAAARKPIRAAAAIDPREGLTVAEERTLLEHYGAPLEAGRQRSLDGRRDDERASIPI